MLESHPFPLIRSGGLFLIVVGIAIVLGACWPRWRWRFFGIGAGFATALVSLTAVSLARPLGVPNRSQLASLVVALAFEIGAIAWVVRHYQVRGERIVILAILLAVGLHFLPMGVAFGPVVVGLGLLSIAIAGTGLSAMPAVGLQAFWTFDGLAKLVAGLIMFVLAPRWSFW